MGWSRWIWCGTSPNASSEELKRRYASLKNRGIDGVFLGGGIDDREFEIVRECGLDLHCWMWTLNRGERWIRENHPEWFMVSRTGKSCFDQPPYVDYYRWLSPFAPGVETYLRDRVAELAAHPAVQGVHLDYVRFPDVILPRGLWEQYGLDQSEEMPEYDFDYSDQALQAFGRTPEDPAHDQEWLHFRYDAVSRIVRSLKEEASRQRKELTAAVFPTPSLARRICRQDWDKWPLDAVCPMLYHSFYLQDVDWIGSSMVENIQAARFPVIAGLYMPAFDDPAEFERAIRLVQKRGGSGVSLFGEVAEPFWQAFARAHEPVPAFEAS